MNTLLTHLCLAGNSVDLVLMDSSHIAGLTGVMLQEEIWEFTWRKFTTLEQVNEMVNEAMEQKNKGSQLPFVIIDKNSGQIIGTTRISNIDSVHRHAEIGWTFLSPHVWRKGINTECKFLLLQYCFEQLQLLRVQFLVSGHNYRSQKAVERLGAVKEGILRKHKLKMDGSIHDTIIYSILDSEWPQMKTHLLALMEKKDVQSDAVLS
ncbi:MAG: GNAT family N-acetyltransferase [Candidatus Pristimantibacillus sp.]